MPLPDVFDRLIVHAIWFTKHGATAMTLRVALDTNIWVAAVGWRGVAHQIYQQLLAGRFVHLTSGDILTEISRTLRYLPGFTETLTYD